MANIRQYIGARYVFKIYENSQDHSSAEWEANVTYEPLTIVTYLNSTYASKKDVPGSVGNPAANPQYWIVTGAYNGQIATLQQQIDTINNVTIPAINSDIQDLNDLINSLLVGGKKVIILADSYGRELNADNKNFGQVAADISGVASEFLYSNGCGFVSNGASTFIQLIRNSTSNPDDITDVIVCGGANDYSYLCSENDLVTAIKDFCNYCRTTFPKLQRIAIMADSIVFGSATNYKGAYDRVFAATCYTKGALASGATFITNSQYIMHDTRLLQNDFCHPNANGVNALGNYVAAVMLGNDVINVSNYCEDTDIITLSSEMTDLGGLPLSGSSYTTKQYRQNGSGSICGSDGSLSMFGVRTTGVITPNSIHELGTMANSLFSTYDYQFYGWQSIPGRMYTNAAHTTFAPATFLFTIQDNVVKFTFAPEPGGASCYGFVPDVGELVLSTN